MDREDPGVPLRVLVNNCSSLITRTVIDDDPLGRANRLVYEGFKGFDNVLFLIPHR